MDNNATSLLIRELTACLVGGKKGMKREDINHEVNVAFVLFGLEGNVEGYQIGKERVRRYNMY